MCSFYHEPLHNCIETNTNKFAISNRTASKLGIQILRSYLKLSCEYEVHTISDTKVSAGKDHGENYIKSQTASGPLPFAYLSIGVYIWRKCKKAPYCQRTITDFFRNME